MPTLGWRWLLVLSSVPSFIVLVFYAIIPESPRYLCMKGRTSEAHQILEKGSILNQKELPLGTLVSGGKTGPDEEFGPVENTHLLSLTRKKSHDFETSSSSLVSIFSPKLIRTTLLLWFLYFGNTFSYYGIILLTSELSSGQSKCSSTAMHLKGSGDASLYVDVFVTSLAGINGLRFPFTFWCFFLTWVPR